MVELSSKSDPFQFSFPNAVFIIPGILFVGLSGESYRANQLNTIFDCVEDLCTYRCVCFYVKTYVRTVASKTDEVLSSRVLECGLT